MNPKIISRMRRGDRPARVTKILAPINFSAESQSALRYAQMFARRFGASITLLHVVEPIVRVADYGYGTVTTCCPNPHLVKNAEVKLRALIGRRSRSGAGWDILVRTGIAETEILQAVREIDADLIVMGGSENCHPSQPADGSTAVRVVRQAQCPVLVVRKKQSTQTTISKRSSPTWALSRNEPKLPYR